MSASVCDKHGVLGCGDCELEALRVVIARREAVIRILEDDIQEEKRRADEAEAKIAEIYVIAERGDGDLMGAIRSARQSGLMGEQVALAMQSAGRHYCHIKGHAAFEFEASLKKKKNKVDAGDE